MLFLNSIPTGALESRPGLLPLCSIITIAISLHITIESYSQHHVFLYSLHLHLYIQYRYVFDRLKGIENTVILFDEIEEFCLDRENPSLAMESRLLTTAMLTLLNTLRREQKNIFIVATNRLKSFDAAVIRPGRYVRDVREVYLHIYIYAY